MTIPNKHDNNIDDTRGATPWYRAPVVWLGITITIAVIIGAIATVVISHKNAQSQPSTPKDKSEGITHILGVPLSKSRTDKDSDSSPD